MSDSKVLKLKPEDFKKKNYKAGDLIVTTKDFGERFGEVVDVNEDDDLEVYFIEPNPSKANGKVYEYCDDWEVLPKSGVSKHVCIPKNKMNYPKCYRAIGLRVWDGVIFTLWSSNEETDEDLKNFEFPTDCIDVDSSDDDEEDMSDIIAPDAECEPFRPASPSSAFVQEVHTAVHMYNDWVPSTKKGCHVKTFVDTMEAKYVHLDDNQHFERGTCVDYTRPPLSKRLKSVESQ